MQSAVPEAWDNLEFDVDVAEPREKVTLWLDRSVARFLDYSGAAMEFSLHHVLV